MRIVLDSSVVLAWIVPDETNESIRELFERVGDEGILVPAHWRLEVANGLTMAMRRGRLPDALRRSGFADLRLIDTRVDNATDEHAWSGTLSLADRFRLTLYDAAYLELAQRASLPLASLDNPLKAAAESAGVELVDVKL